MSEVQEPLYTSSKPTHSPLAPTPSPHQNPTLCHRGGKKKAVLRVYELSFQLKCWLAAFYQPTDNIWYIKTHWKNKVYVAGRRSWSHRPKHQNPNTSVSKKKAVLLASLVPCELIFFFTSQSFQKEAAWGSKLKKTLIWYTDIWQSWGSSITRLYGNTCAWIHIHILWMEKLVRWFRRRKTMLSRQSKMHSTHMEPGYYNNIGTVVVMPTAKIHTEQHWSGRTQINMCWCAEKTPQKYSTERNSQ